MPTWDASDTSDRWLKRAAGTAALVAGVIVMHAVVFGRPLPGIAVLLLPAVPLLFAGQIRVISIVQERRPQPSGSWLDRMAAQMQRNRDPRSFFFAGLSRPATNGLLAVVLLSWLAAVTALPALTTGNPRRGTAGCPWELDSHGQVTCVSHATYESASAAVQRFAGGILLVFFVVHFGAISGELSRRHHLEGDAT